MALAKASPPILCVITLAINNIPLCKDHRDLFAFLTGLHGSGYIRIFFQRNVTDILLFTQAKLLL